MINWHSFKLSSDYFSSHPSDALPQPFIRHLKEKSTQTSPCTFGFIIDHNEVFSLVLAVFALVFNLPSLPANNDVDNDCPFLEKF